jgi:YD repeat-containing protein
MIAAALVSCKKYSSDPAPIPPEEKFVVERIIDHLDRTLAVYHYNANSQLIRVDHTDPVNGNNRNAVFEWENGKIIMIQVNDLAHPTFSHQVKIFYDASGRVRRDETWKEATYIGHLNYARNANGKIDHLYRDNGEPNYFISYDHKGNAVHVKELIRDSMTGEIREQFRDFLFDDHKRPDFGAGEIFQVELLPGFGTEARIEKNISRTNMIRFEGSGTQWIYTYNEHGLPATIETKWAGITTTDPMLLKLHYWKLE